MLNSKQRAQIYLLRSPNKELYNLHGSILSPGPSSCGRRSTIHPYYVSKEHYFASLLIKFSKCHEQVKHNGVRNTITCLEKEFWIRRARKFIKSVINKCTTYGRHEGPLTSDYPKHGPLPEVHANFDFRYAVIRINYCA